VPDGVHMPWERFEQEVVMGLLGQIHCLERYKTGVGSDVQEGCAGPFLCGSVKSFAKKLTDVGGIRPLLPNRLKNYPVPG
jgi:hypothetical protein